MPQQRKNKGGRLPLVIENARVDLAIQAMRLNPGNAYRAATWVKQHEGCSRRAAVNLLARARERIVAACQADMSSAFGELYADVREAMAKCRPQAATETEPERPADWPAFFRGAIVAAKLIELYLDKIRREQDEDTDDAGEIVFRIVDSVVIDKESKNAG